MKNTVNRLLTAGLLVVSFASMAMDDDERGKGEEEVVETKVSWLSSGVSVARKWVLPAAVLFGGAYAAKNCRGEARGLGGAAILYGGKSLGQNLWNAWRGPVEGSGVDATTELVALQEKHKETQLALGATLWATMAGGDTGKQERFVPGAVDRLVAAAKDRGSVELEAQVTMVRAMEVAREDADGSGLYTGQLRTVQGLLADKAS